MRPSPEPMSPSEKKKKKKKKKKTSPKLKMLGPLCNQRVTKDTPTVYYSILRLKCSPSILKKNKG